MSVNPLFTGPVPNKRPPIYNNSASHIQRKANNILCQTNINSGNMNCRSSPGPRKKPRMSDLGGSEMTNDSDPFQAFDSFTEDDLETFDMIASQALSQQPHPDLGQPDQALKRPTVPPRIPTQPKSSSLMPASTTQVGNKSGVASNIQASSVYGSLQHSSSVGGSGVGRFSFKSTISRGGKTQAPATSGMPQRVPTPTFPQAQNRAHTIHPRQSNVTGTKIYYTCSSQYRTGSTPPGSHQQVENLDSSKAQSLGPNRITGPPKQTIQSNVGPKITASKLEPYLGTSKKMGANPTLDGPQGLHVDINNKNTNLAYHAKPEPHLQHTITVGGTIHSAPSQGGGRSIASLTPPTGAIARISPGLPTTERDSGSSQMLLTLQQQQVTKYRAEYEVVRQQLKRLTEDMFTKDGEIQVLRHNLSRAKAETGRLQKERLEAEEMRKQHINEVERDLKKQNESLKTQLHFKEAELMQAHSAAQNHRTRPPVPSTSTNTPTTPTKHPSTSVADRTKKDVGDPDMFPTQQSFMADNPKVERGHLRSPRVRTLSEGQSVHKSPNRSPRGNIISKSPGNVSPSPSSSVQYGKPPRGLKRTCLLSTRLEKASSADVQLVGSLLQDRDVGTGSSPGGLMSLVQSTGWERVSSEGTEAVISIGQPSPAKPKRVSPNKGPSLEHKNKINNPSVELATRAISNILNPPRIPPLPPHIIPPTESTLHPSPNHPQIGRSLVVEFSDTATYITDLLPLLEDQLTSYIDTSHSISLSNAPSLCSTCPSSSSGGSRGSMDSSASSSPSEKGLTLGHLESAVLTSMALLRHMVTCSPAVRTGVLRGSVFRDAQPPGSDGEVSAMEIDPSAPLIDTTQAPSKSNVLPSVHHEPTPQPTDSSPVQRTNRILSKLMRIASMQHGLGNCSAVVELSLDVLHVLVEKSSNEEKERLQSLLVHDALYNSMSRDSTFIQASLAVDILAALSLSWKLACKLCNQSDSCLLLQCYHCGVYGTQSCNTPQKIQLTVKVISMLWRIIRAHHQGVAMLLDTDCQCSMELINAVVLMFRRVLDVTLAMQVYKHPTQYWRYTLNESLLLLHCLAMTDRNFTDHRLEVEKFYIAAVTSLSKLYRKIPDVTDNETGLVHDLWDFIQWDETEWEPEDEDEQQGVAMMEVDQ